MYGSGAEDVGIEDKGYRIKVPKDSPKDGGMGIEESRLRMRTEVTKYEVPKSTQAVSKYIITLMTKIYKKDIVSSVDTCSVVRER